MVFNINIDCQCQQFWMYPTISVSISADIIANIVSDTSKIRHEIVNVHKVKARLSIMINSSL